MSSDILVQSKSASLFKSKSMYWTIASFVLLAMVVIALGTGPIAIDLLAIINGTATELEQSILLNIRLPRVLLSLLVGAALGISGAAMQGLFRNPLADPTLIGISGGAALAVGFVIVIVGPMAGLAGLYGIGAAAFLGGVVTSLVILQLSRISGSFSVTHMLLAGIALNALTFAGTGVLMFLSNDQEMRALTFWTMGSLGGALWPPVIFAASITIPSILALLFKATDLNIFMLGEENAAYMGVDTKRLKLIIITVSALGVGASVAVSGLIGFVGLIVPHLVRLMFSSNHHILIPGSALTGAALLLVADTFARIIVSPAEMPVGVLTSLIGGPFFLWLLIRQVKGQ